MKKSWTVLLASILLLAGCVKPSPAAPFETVRAMVADVDQFGDVLFDLETIALSYGDSVNVSFSGGYAVSDIPFYPDYYGRKGDTILTDFGEVLAVAGIQYDFNGTAKIEEGETVTIELSERGKYKELYEAYHVDNDRTPWEGQTNAEYMNARMISAGKVKPNTLYRSASPFEASFGRVELMDSFIQTYGIQCILDLADSEEDLRSYTDLPAHTLEMIRNNQVICFHIGNDFGDPEAMKSLAEGLRRMTGMEGPYLIQCSLGRDRTGVLAALLEALCDASYTEIVEDYMISYDLLHHVDINLEVGTDSLQYELFKARLDDSLETILNTPKENLPDTDLKARTMAYLKECGMREEDLQNLIDLLHR